MNDIELTCILLYNAKFLRVVIFHRFGCLPLKHENYFRKNERTASHMAKLCLQSMNFIFLQNQKFNKFMQFYSPQNICAVWYSIKDRQTVSSSCVYDFRLQIISSLIIIGYNI